MNALISAPSLTLRGWLMSLWLPVGLLLAGYVIASHVVAKQEMQQQQRIREAVAEKLTQIAEGVREKVTLYQYGLRGTRGSVMSISPQRYNYHDMQTYTRSRDYKLEFPGARGFGLIKLVKTDEKNAFLERMARERPDYPFEITQLTPHNDSLFIIQYIEPEQDNSQAVGLDIGSEPMRRQAALDAASANDVRLTAPITLVQANEQPQQGFLILMPVYLTPSVPESTAQRLEALYGWSYAPILINDVLSTVTGLQQDVLLSIEDITGTEPIAFFRRGSAEHYNTELQQQFELALFGRSWLLTLAPTTQFINALHLPSTRTLFWEVMGLTALLTLVIYLLQMMIMRRTQLIKHKQELAEIAEQTLLKANAELERQVALRTAEISQVNTLQRSILNGAGYAIIATDIQGIITAFNPAAEHLLGYNAAELLHKQTPAIFHLPEEVGRYAEKLSAELGFDVEPGFDTFVAKAKLGKQDNHRWTYVTKKGNKVQVKLNVSALTDEQGQLVGFLGIAFDLTEQLKREAELAQAKEQAESASKAKSDFLANMSHEIRTPMNAILGLLQLVANTELNRRQADYIEKTRSAATSLLTLLNDILDFSKVEAGKLELDPHPFNLALLLQDLGLILSSSSEQKELEVLYDIAADVPADLLGDSFRIKQVLLNLAGNAIKFTEQGEVVISMQAQPQADGQIRLCCSVKDTGIGMTAQQQQAIFTGFHQAESSISRRYGGTGLGLAISKRLVNLMGGTIQVESKPGSGSTFSFDILLHTAPENSSGANQQNVSLSANALRVLIVDDNDSARLILQDIATSLGWLPDIAANANEASLLLTQSHDNNDAYDVVFVDWRMPDMNGLELAQYIRESHGHKVPLVVMITAFGKEVLMEHAVAYERYLDGFLIKPVTHQMMRNAVETIFHGDTAIPQPDTAVQSGKPLAGLTLLLVEDNLTNQLVASELLLQQGANIQIAGSGSEALLMLEHNTPSVDLVLMDLQMPGIDGYETTRRIRQWPQFQQLPIIAMTANALASDKAACLAVGMQDHIAKPFSLDEVIAKILRYSNAGTAQHITEPAQANTLFDTKVLAYGQQHQIELEAACKRLGQSAELYTKVLTQFGNDLSHSLRKLAQTTLSKNEARLLFHSVKGAAGTVGFSRLAQHAANLETELSQQQQESYQAQDHTVLLLEQAVTDVTALLALLQTDKVQSRAATNARVSDNAELLAALKQHLSHANMAALPLYQQLSATLHTAQPELNAKLEKAILNLAFDEAEVILEQIITKQDE